MSSSLVKSGRSVRAMVWTAIRLAISPRLCPPMPSATIRRSRVRGSDRNAMRSSTARMLSSSTGRTRPTFEAKPTSPRVERMIVSDILADTPFPSAFRVILPAPASSATLECDRHVRPSPRLVHEGDDIPVGQLLAFESPDLSIGPPAVVRHRRAVQAAEVLNPAAPFPILENPGVMLRQVPFRIEDADLGRVPEASLRTTLVAGLVVPADLHLALDLALLSQHDEVRKLERFPRSAGHRLRHVLGRREPFLRVERHGPRRDIRKLLRNAGFEVAGGSEEFGFTGRELLHRSLGVFGGQEEEEDRAHAVQIARRRRLPQVLLRGPPTRCVDDGSGPGELVELLLRRPEVEEDDLSAGVEDDVLGLHIPVDHVPRVKVRQRLEELEDVSSGRRRVGRLVLVQLRQRLALELFLDEAERSEVGAFVHISDDPWMTRGLEGLQDLGFDPKPFLGLGQIEAAGLFHDDGLTAVGLAEINGRHPSFRQLADDFVAALTTFQGAGKGEGHTIRRPYLTTNCSVTSSATSISSSFWSSVRPVPVTRMRELPRTSQVLFVLGFRCTMVVPSSTKNRSPSWKTVRWPREISFACFGLGRNFAKSVRPINHWDGGIGCSVLSGKTR